MQKRHLSSLRRLVCRLTSADFGRTIRCTQIGPIHIRPQLLATHRAARFALDGNTQIRAQALIDRTGLTQVANRRAALASKSLLPSGIKAI